MLYIIAVSLTWLMQASELKLWCSFCSVCHEKWSTSAREGGRRAQCCQVRIIWCFRDLCFLPAPSVPGQRGKQTKPQHIGHALGSSLPGCSVRLSFTTWLAVHSPQGSDMGGMGKIRRGQYERNGYFKDSMTGKKGAPVQAGCYEIFTAALQAWGETQLTNFWGSLLLQPGHRAPLHTHLWAIMCTPALSSPQSIKGASHVWSVFLEDKVTF